MNSENVKENFTCLTVKYRIEFLKFWVIFEVHKITDHSFYLYNFNKIFIFSQTFP